MTKKLAALFLAVMMLFSAALAEITVTDMKGRTVTLEAPATRIVALTAADCEILCALGCEEMLVGRGAYCDYPASILSIPSVQSGMDTNIEQILALEPQIVFMSEMNQTVEQVQQLESNGIRVVVSENSSIQGTYEAIRMIGALVGKDAEAEAMVAQMQTAFADIAAAAPATGKTVYFEITPIEWGYGLYTAGAGTFMDEIAAICGLTNVFADLQSFPAVSEEQVLARNPDYIIAVSGQTDAETAISTRAGWQDVTAVREGRVLNADVNAFSRPGPRLVEAAQALFNFITE